MSKRKPRSLEELKGVSTAHMTPEEYELSDTPGTYRVDRDGARYIVTGMHSARVVSGGRGTITKIGD